jgi:outer membrane protein TolC
LHTVQAAYAQINLTGVAAEASLKNYELVSEAYARGAVNVIELLDAQETSLTAAAASAESLYFFLTEIMVMQRAVGGFDYLLPPAEREALAAEFRSTFRRGQE